MQTQVTDWADKYKGAPTLSYDYWVYRVACYTVNCTEEFARKVANTIVSLPVYYRNVWHGVSVTIGNVAECPCAKCRLQR
jgi:hypothetical protein